MKILTSLGCITGHPGSSWTANTNRWASPPRFVKVDDALNYVVGQLKKPKNRDTTKKLIYSGTPVSVLASTISLQGFADNMWNPDIAELIKPAVKMYLTSVAIEDGDDIPFRLDGSNSRTRIAQEVEEDFNFLEKMRVQNPELARRLEAQSRMQAAAKEEQQNQELAMRREERFKEQKRQAAGGFLNPPKPTA